ncbi:hypothetical protein [Kitasatospora acidiphila]|uniref:hypothetical protein n=1 Tax=Kitasatospora acidiphila TaxID=2567942 RepID=UPI003C74F077
MAALFTGSALGAALGGGAAADGRFGTVFGLAAAAAVPLTVAVVLGCRRFTAHG